jgi:hypothetical protein
MSPSYPELPMLLVLLSNEQHTAFCLLTYWQVRSQWHLAFSLVLQRDVRILVIRYCILDISVQMYNVIIRRNLKVKKFKINLFLLLFSVEYTSMTYRKVDWFSGKLLWFFFSIFLCILRGAFPHVREILFHFRFSDAKFIVCVVSCPVQGCHIILLLGSDCSHSVVLFVANINPN